MHDQHQSSFFLSLSISPLYRCCSSVFEKKLESIFFPFFENFFFLEKKRRKLIISNENKEDSLVSLSQCTATCNYHQWLCHRELGLNHEHHWDRYKYVWHIVLHHVYTRSTIIFLVTERKKRHVDVLFSFLF